MAPPHLWPCPLALNPVARPRTRPAAIPLFNRAGRRVCACRIEGGETGAQVAAIEIWKFGNLKTAAQGQ